TKALPRATEATCRIPLFIDSCDAAHRTPRLTTTTPGMLYGCVIPASTLNPPPQAAAKYLELALSLRTATAYPRQVAAKNKIAKVSGRPERTNQTSPGSTAQIRVPNKAPIRLIRSSRVTKKNVTRMPK